MPYIINNKSLMKDSAHFVFGGCFLIIPLIIYSFFSFFGIDLINFIYNYKFREIDDIFFYCNILGFIQYLQVLSYFLIGATLDNKKIKIISFLNLFIIFLIFPMYHFFNPNDSIISAILYFIVIWLLRFFISLYYLVKDKFVKENV